MTADVRLVTQRLVLRRFRSGDAGALAAYRSDPAVARYQSWDVPVTLEAAAELTEVFAGGNLTRPGRFQYAVERLSDSVLVGDVGVSLHHNRMQAEIGFTLASDCQGRGYATEAVGQVLEHLFTTRNLRWISAQCDARNTSSLRLLRRLGFVEEGRQRTRIWVNCEWTDHLLLRLLAANWRPSEAPCCDI
ncbi:MAG: GNAT family N-acetyltransferase [Actinomycetota bacterium]|nr:GNAT family N-acetyltransferase [Actinomycetota bacterium]